MYYRLQTYTFLIRHLLSKVAPSPSICKTVIQENQTIVVGATTERVSKNFRVLHYGNTLVDSTFLRVKEFSSPSLTATSGHTRLTFTVLEHFLVLLFVDFQQTPEIPTTNLGIKSVD